jgi:hypothetical protein
VSAAAAAVETGRLLLDALAGRASPPASLPSVPELVERAGDGEDVGALAVAHAQHTTLAGRVAAAVAADGATVTLADGDTWPLPHAERQLAQKEERRVYLPLRLPLERAMGGALRPMAALRDLQRALPVAVAVAIPGSTLARLRRFVDDTTAAAGAAREHLERAGGAPLDGEAALRRGLDLPGPATWSSDGVVAAVRLAFSHDAVARRPARTPAPRLLCGHVVDDGATPRLLVAPCLSAGRHLALSHGAGVVVGAAIDAPAHAAGLGLALVDAATRRALGQARDEAAAAFRTTVATALLWARARAAVAAVRAKVSTDDDALEELRELTRGACRTALQGDAGGLFVEALLAPPWPDGRRLSLPAVAAVDAALHAARAAGSWLQLREALDEGFVARAHGLRALVELPADDVAEDGGARAWNVLVAELL